MTIDTEDTGLKDSFEDFKSTAEGDIANLKAKAINPGNPLDTVIGTVNSKLGNVSTFESVEDIDDRLAVLENTVDVTQAGKISTLEGEVDDLEGAQIIDDVFYVNDAIINITQTAINEEVEIGSFTVSNGLTLDFASHLSTSTTRVGMRLKKDDVLVAESVSNPTGTQREAQGIIYRETLPSLGASDNNTFDFKLYAYSR